MSSLYQSASSAIKLNGVEGSTFPLGKSVRQGCPLSPYLFILATDVLGHMLNDHRFGVKGLALPGGGKITDQTFADDTCHNPSFGLAIKAKGLQGCGPKEAQESHQRLPGV